MKKSLFKRLLLVIVFAISLFNNQVQVQAQVQTQIPDDEVLDDSSSVNDYRVYINGEEVTSYDLINNNQVQITQVYDGDNTSCTFDNEEMFVIDYSNKLYGQYNYKLSLNCDGEVVDSKDITINYLGDNNSVINTNGIYYNNGNYFILSDIGKEITVLDVMDLFNQELYLYNFSLGVFDVNGIELLDDEIVESGDILRLGALYEDYGFINELVDEFVINIVDDVNGDGVVDNFDIKCMMVDDMLNDDENTFNINDVVDVGIEEIVPSTDILEQTIENETITFIDEIIEVKYYINGFLNDSLSGVMGDIIYDKEILELTSIEINSIYGTYNVNGSFVYLLENYNIDGLFITFKFKALKEGSSNIALENLKFVTSGGDYIVVNGELSDEVISVIENGKGGDVEDKVEEEKDIPKVETLNKQEVVVSPVIEVYEELLPSKSTSYINLSSDNYIKELKIEGYEIEFDKDIFEYSINVSNDVSKLKLDIELSDNDSYYLIEGNNNFKVGDNKVVITVTSLDGNNRTYVINVEKDGNILEEEDNLDEEKKSSRNIIIMLIILVIIGLVYVIFGDEKEEIG